jgi:hypothetical protein
MTSFFNNGVEVVLVAVVVEVCVVVVVGIVSTIGFLVLVTQAFTKGPVVVVEDLMSSKIPFKQFRR